MGAAVNQRQVPLLGVDGLAVLPLVREHARSTCDTADVGATMTDDVEVCLSELVTNAHLHGRGPVGLRVLVDGGTVRIEVHDGSRDPPVLAPHPDAGGGYGLILVDRLSSGWGFDLAPDGKCVWASFSPSPPARRAGPVVTPA